MSAIDLNPESCRRRQQRLMEVMQQLELDLVVVSQLDHVQYLAAPRFAWWSAPLAALNSEGQLTLVAPNIAPDATAADKVLTYEAQWMSTIRNEQRQASADVLLDALKGATGLQRVGVEFSSCPPYLTEGMDVDFVDIEPALFQLRRRKEQDELAMIRRAIAATRRMYELAREIVEPGVNELDVYGQLRAAAVLEVGEMLTGFGNDFQCCSPGGPPRDRKAQAGELYIFDLGPGYRGYFADNCRTIAVDDPSDEQMAAWEQIAAVFPHVERIVKPGQSAKELYAFVFEMLKSAPIGTFTHHLGHGMGLFPHEPPHLNPKWDECFEEGDVFTVEPGLYDERLKAGIRIEHNYLVTGDGVELLTDFPIGLN